MQSKDGLKILQMRSSIGFFGAENVIIELGKEFKSRRIICYIGVIQNTNKNSKYLSEIANTSSLPNVLFPGTSPFSFLTLYSILNFVKKHQISIIHSHGYKANLYAFLIKLITRVPAIATCHPWTEINYNKKALLYKLFDLKILSAFNKLIAVSENVKLELLKKVNKKEILLIANGIDVKRFSCKINPDISKLFKVGKNLAVIGTVGRLVEEKGYIYLIDAAIMLIKFYPDLLFLFIGDGPLLSELNYKVERHQLGNKIKFLGVRNNIPQLLSAIDIFVLPSLSEGMPMALLEAMAAGKAVVATNVGDIPKIIIHKKNGLLVSPANTSELVSSISLLLKNKTLAQEIGKSAKEHIRKNYSATIMAQKYYDVYMDVLKNSYN